MPGKRDRNLRSGFVHEEMGLMLLRPLALLAPVPLWEDVGLDTVGTLLRPEGARRLIPEDSFGVQLKASSEHVVSYEDHDAAKWLVNLDLPLFIGRVRIKDAAIDLFPTHALFKIHWHPGLKEVHLHLGHLDQVETWGTPEVGRVNIGPAALTWSTDKLADPDFHSSMYPVLKGHIVATLRNIRGRPMGHVEGVQWRPNELPTLSGGKTLHFSGSGKEAQDALTALEVPLRSLLLVIGRPENIEHLPAVFSFMKVMRTLGFDPDPGDLALSMAAISALRIRDRKIVEQLAQMGLALASQYLDRWDSESRPPNEP